ncbi:hypothetical protein [Streptomyces microflavus]|uniref:hypothetical protein n=1 Tax=Streptomyces microflavus TaxID=1919 RepID=UPI0033DDD33A
MIRKHLPDIIYVVILVALALPYGVFVGTVRAPLWLSLVLCAVTGIVIAIAVDPLARSIVRRLDDRARVRGYGWAVANAPVCAHCQTPILAMSVTVPSTVDGVARSWHLDADHLQCREAYAADRAA